MRHLRHVHICDRTYDIVSCDRLTDTSSMLQHRDRIASIAVTLSACHTSKRFGTATPSVSPTLSISSMLVSSFISRSVSSRPGRHTSIRVTFTSQPCITSLHLATRHPSDDNDACSSAVLRLLLSASETSLRRRALSARASRRARSLAGGRPDACTASSRRAACVASCVAPRGRASS